MLPIGTRRRFMGLPSQEDRTTRRVTLESASPVTSSPEASPEPTPKPPRDSLVTFAASPQNSSAVVTPYSQVYGVHPDLFDFDRRGRMVPVGGAGSLAGCTPSAKAQAVFVVAGGSPASSSPATSPQSCRSAATGSPVGFAPLVAAAATTTPRAAAAVSAAAAAATTPCGRGVAAEGPGFGVMLAAPPVPTAAVTTAAGAGAPARFVAMQAAPQQPTSATSATAVAPVARRAFFVQHVPVVSRVQAGSVPAPTGVPQQQYVVVQQQQQEQQAPQRR